MNSLFTVRGCGILFLVLSFLSGASAGGPQQEKEIERLAKTYRAAQTEFERRAVCLDAIDAGIIAQDHSVSLL